MLWHMSDCFLWQPNRLHTKRWRPRPINRFVAHGGQKSDWAWNWIQSHRSSWLWWLWRCRAEFLLPGSSWSKKYSCAPGWRVMDLTRGSLYDLFIIFIIPVCLLHSVTFCYCAWSGSDRICARWASIDCRSEAKSPSALNLCWGRRLCSELSITALNWEYWEHVNILRKCIWAILSHILTCFEAISDLIISHSAACGALRIGGLVMCFLNPPKLAMDEASDGASMPHGLMAHATRLGSSWFSGC